MEADFAVELGPEDDRLEVPWASLDRRIRYYDLKRQPEQLRNIEEAVRVPELGDFLTAINSPSGILETAKCDAWSTTEMTAEDEMFGAACKFGCYVDCFFSDPHARISFAGHEQLASRITQLLKRAPEIPAAVEFLIRRCFYHSGQDTLTGFYITLYSFGYGKDEVHARQQWVIGLKLVEHAMRQLSVIRPA